MDIQKYIESGILEEYVFGTLSTDEMVEVHEFSMQYPEILQAINAIDNVVTQKIAVPAPPGLLDLIMSDLPPDNMTQGRNEAPAEKDDQPEDRSMGSGGSGRKGFPSWLTGLLFLFLLGSLGVIFYLLGENSKLESKVFSQDTTITDLQSRLSAAEDSLDNCEDQTSLIAELFPGYILYKSTNYGDTTSIRLEDSKNKVLFIRNPKNGDIQALISNSDLKNDEQLVAWTVNVTPNGPIAGALGIIGEKFLPTEQMSSGTTTHLGITLEKIRPDGKLPTAPNKSTVQLVKIL